MAGKAKSRRDSKHRVLRRGESIRADGKYQFKYHVNGKPHFVYSWRLEPTDTLPVGKKPCLSLRELEKQIGYDLDSLSDPLGKNITVGELVERYLATKTAVKPNTLTNYKFVQNLLRGETFNDKKISQVKTSDAKLFLIKLQQDGRHYSTVKTVRGVLRPAFQMAVDDDVLMKNPFGFELAGVVVNDSVTREAITKDQMRKFLKFIHDDNVYCKYYEVVYILFHTGMRISEFCGLTLKDINLENKVINIDHQLQRTSDMRLVIESTKTNAGTRKLPMTEDVAQCFRGIIEDREPPRFEKVIDGYSGFLFTDKDCNPLVAMHWEHRFNHMVKRYNDIYRVQMPNITPHVCRHTYCSNMAKSGMNPKTLQYLMGHSDIGVTLNTYTHLGLEDVTDELRRMEDLKNIAKLLSGFGSVNLPECIKIDENALYECCYDMGWETSILDESNYNVERFISFLCQLADEENLILFIDYYFNTYIENRVNDLTVAGYSIFQLKDKVLVSLNALWSIPNQEFGLDNSKFSLKTVDFKEYDKMGEGGFCTVYRCPTDSSRVYKVLNSVEKAEVSSVHRFKREYEIMSEQNNSGYTLNVFDYDSQALVYSIEKASVSLEDYVEKVILSNEEKDEIVLRCAECMKYLHSQKIIHRDFHPGNILMGSSNEWLVTDFGLAKDISSKYSHQTTTTHAVGRAWFTDPIQLFALKEGNFKTDMFSLAKTIDFVMNGNMSGSPHKYSSVVYKATAPNHDSRYENINEMYDDLVNICGRPDYESPEEIAEKLLVEYKKSGRLNVIQLIDLFNGDSDGTLMWQLAIKFGLDIAEPFINIIDISFEVALREIRRDSSVMRENYHSWDDYDVIAYWAIEVIKSRKNRNDEINIEAVNIIEYVASNVGRFRIKSASNILKNDSTIDGHIRAQLSYHEGY